MINRMANACFSGLTAFALALGATSAPAFAASDSFITLGTEGGPVSNPLRSQPANVLLDDGNAYLIDVGDGAVQRLAAAQILLSLIHI